MLFKPRDDTNKNKAFNYFTLPGFNTAQGMMCGISPRNDF